MKESISFDRAAGFYDASRSLPSEPAEAITRALLDEIGASGAERVLEVGIGTGRMARPLLAEGVQMVGVDISIEMMGQLQAQLTDEHAQPDLLLGDATRLPFRDGAFRAVLVVHVLHLVGSLETAIAEVRRVIPPVGVLLQQTRRPTEATQHMWDESDVVWDRLFAARGYKRTKQRYQPEVREAIAATGAKLRLVDVIDSAWTQTVEEELRRLHARSSSWTWSVPNDVFDDALPEYEVWLRAAAPDGTFTDDVTYEIEVWRWD